MNNDNTSLFLVFSSGLRLNLAHIESIERYTDDGSRITMTSGTVRVVGENMKAIDQLIAGAMRRAFKLGVDLAKDMAPEPEDLI